VKDYNVTVKVRNNHLLTAMRDNGYFTAAELSRASGVTNSVIGDYLNLKRAPLLIGGAWSRAVLKLADTLKRLPEDLFPKLHWTEVLRKNTAEVEMEFSQIQAISAGQTPEEIAMFSESVMQIDSVLKCLTAREESVIRAHFYDGKTLDEIGLEWCISRERVRQIEARGLRKLRHKSISNKLVGFLPIYR
jgi:DNA-binding CsgD family transcriptional regulator